MDYEFGNQEIEAMTQWVTFMLEGEKYGIDVMHVKEVLRDIEIAPVPGAPPYVLGIINLRGNVVTVVDTRSRFNLPPREIDDNTRVIVIETEDQSLGLLVDQIAEVADIPKSGIEMTPNLSTDDNSKFIMGVYSAKGDLIILVDMGKLLGEEESMDGDLY
ncbi:MAG: chemotaxis protein CheW [Gammaproteobacteria bacterium]|nr:chemotaxis protein CheW [Gammaproteobacteria bacterium]